MYSHVENSTVTSDCKRAVTVTIIFDIMSHKVNASLGIVPTIPAKYQSNTAN